MTIFVCSSFLCKLVMFIFWHFLARIWILAFFLIGGNLKLWWIANWGCSLIVPKWFRDSKCLEFETLCAEQVWTGLCIDTKTWIWKFYYKISRAMGKKGKEIRFFKFLSKSPEFWYPGVDMGNTNSKEFFSLTTGRHPSEGYNPKRPIVFVSHF